jgi:hypothetical protein
MTGPSIVNLIKLPFLTLSAPMPHSHDITAEPTLFHTHLDLVETKERITV